ncbi:MAG: hypothetical protein Q4G30_02655 [Actinomycetaceae bacterium]|nr:hypothetical protein [Actinomycetaceae bacterium]
MATQGRLGVSGFEGLAGLLAQMEAHEKQISEGETDNDADVAQDAPPEDAVVQKGDEADGEANPADSLVRNVLGNVLDIDAGELPESTCLEADLGLSELQRWMVITQLELGAKVQIKDEAARACCTVGDLIDVLKQSA